MDFLINEQFSPIPGYEGLYAVSPKGEVWSVRKQRRKCSHRVRSASRKGAPSYSRVTLFGADGVEQKIYLHRLVELVFGSAVAEQIKRRGDEPTIPAMDD